MIPTHHSSLITHYSSFYHKALLHFLCHRLVVEKGGLPGWHLFEDGDEFIVEFFINTLEDFDIGWQAIRIDDELDHDIGLGKT